MNNLELHALFQAEEKALQRAFKFHGLVKKRLSHERLEALPKLLQDVCTLPDDTLSKKLKAHIEAGAEVDATPANY